VILPQRQKAAQRKKKEKEVQILFLLCVPSWLGVFVAKKQIVLICYHTTKVDATYITETYLFCHSIIPKKYIWN